MNIGIITFHRLYNFGSVLQSYALNKFLSEKGYNVREIDYLQPEQYKRSAILYDSPKRIADLIRNAQVFIYKSRIIKSRNRFSAFVEDYIPTTMPIHNKTELKKLSDMFDVFIAGSDQIWNPNYYGFDEAYLLDFVKDKSKCVSYAASIGCSAVSSSIRSIYKKNLSEFRKVYVRERQASSILESCLGYVPDIVLDPVFLLEENDWDSIRSTVKLKKPYILCYFIGNIDGMREYAKELHKKAKMPLVVIRINLRDMLYNYKRFYECGPQEFLTLIKEAECIFTNSFHATAFSLIFHKNFWTFQSPEKNMDSQARIENLLENVNLTNRIITTNTEITSVKWDENISFEYADKVFLQLKQKSITLLNSAIEEKI